MGTWGIAILSNDLAADLKDDWLYNLGEGLSPEEVSHGLIEYAKEEGVFEEEEEEEYTFSPLSFDEIQHQMSK